jgi:hypothetical protein
VPPPQHLPLGGTVPLTRTLFHVLPCIHNPSVSHTAIPPVVSHTASPFSQAVYIRHSMVGTAATERRRKAHSKSRKGCLQCKRRQYKVSHMFDSSGALPDLHQTLHLIGLPWKHTHSFQCDESFPICSGCKRSNLECSLSTPKDPVDPADSQTSLSHLNMDDLRLLHDWNTISDTKFCDHNAEETWRQQRGREIDLGLRHPYGMSSRSFVAIGSPQCR